MNALPPRAERRRVLIVNRVGHLGGVERVILNLASGLPRHGWEPILACPDGGELAEAARAQGLRVAPTPFDRMRITADPRVLLRYPLAWRQGAAAVERICRDEQVSLIHTHHPVGSLYARRAARSLGLPILLHVHESLPARPLYALALRQAARDYSRYIAVSGAGTALLASIGADLDRGSIIPNGIEARLLDGPPPAPAAEVTGPGPHIGVFGVIEPRKGQDVFLRAAELLARDHPQAQFWIVGPLALKDKAGFQAQIRAMAEKPVLRGRVHFTGFRADVGAWMQAMDVVVQASVKHESLSMVLLEAMALGRPIVATRVGGTEEGIRDGRTGLVVAPGDAPALAAAIARAAGPEGEELGAAAARSARETFAPEVFCRKVAEVYDQIVATHAESRA